MAAMNVRDEQTKMLKELLAEVEPPELGPGPRPGVKSPSQLESLLKTRLATAPTSAAARDLICALVLLWHDHLDAAHQLAQAVENADGSLVHAIMHRREPDYWNSKYWWRRVGQHPCFPELARRVADLLKTRGDRELASKLIPDGEWDAAALVEACQAAAGLLPADDRVNLLREIQRLETEVALEYFLGQKGD